MEIRPKFSFRPGLGATFILSAVVFIAVMLSGTWLLANLAQQWLEAEVKLRGRSLAAQFASQLYSHLKYGDNTMVNSLSNGMLREDDLRYLIVIDRQGKMLVSNSRLSWRPMSMPNELHTSVCQTGDAIIRPRQIGSEKLYDIAVRLAPLSLITETHSSLADLDAACLGAFHLGLSRQRLLDHQRSARFLAWGISFLAMFGVAVVYCILRTRLVKPLLEFSKTLHQMPGEECQRALGEITSYGEIGNLKSALLHVAQMQRQKMDSLQQHRVQIQTLSKTLREKNTRLSARLQQQGHSLHKLSELASKNIKCFDRLHEDLQGAVKAAMSASQNTGDIEASVGATIAGVQDIREQGAASTERIVELGEKIAQISNVVKMINTIAAQTKLIAFNASIEAAGAGESGGRFSIVATEVRRLANTAVESVEEIKDSVSSIQTATSELILSSETGLRKINQGVLQISTVRETLLHMNELLKNNSVSLSEVLESIHLQGQQEQLVVNDLKDILLQFEEAIEGVSHTHEIIQQLDTIARGLEG